MTFKTTNCITPKNITIMINPCYAIQLGDNKFAERGWYYVIDTSEKNEELKLARQ